MHTWGAYMLCRAPTRHYFSCHRVAWRYIWSSRQLSICPSPLPQDKPFPPAIAFLPPNMAFTFLLKLASPYYSRSGCLNTSHSVCLAFFVKEAVSECTALPLLRHLRTEAVTFGCCLGSAAQAAIPGVRGLKKNTPFPPPLSLYGQTQTKASSQLRVKHMAWTQQGRPSPCRPQLKK